VKHVPDSDPFTSRQLTKTLEDFGVTLTPTERKHFLTLTSRTVIKKLKQLHAAKPVPSKSLPESKPKPKLIPVPPLGTVIDGLTSYGTYHVIARKEGCIVSVRDLGDTFKVKFHPTATAWGVKEQDLVPIGATHFIDRAGKNEPLHRHYQRAILPRNALPTLIEMLHALRGVETLNQVNAELALENKSLLQGPEAEFVKPRAKAKQLPKSKMTTKKKPREAKILNKRPTGLDLGN
jgi:hypothetical protein